MAVESSVEPREDAPATPVTVDVRLDGVTKRFDDVVAVDELSLEIDRGSFFALLGPSGCGKTTTLRMIGGFEEPSEGTIYLGEEPVTGRPPYKRDVNTVFQSYALFPHLTIFENVAFGLRRRRIRGQDVKGRVTEILRLVGLSGLDKRKPRQLSGGQQQRVALARALVNRPRVLLLDEPLGALDLKLRKQMQLELKAIQHDIGITFVHVTHDQDEAMTMADQIAIMRAGKIEQLGTPTELYEQPRTAFVAGFLGISNLLPGTVTGPSAVRLDDGTEVRVPAEAIAGRTGRVAVGVRPEKIRLGHGEENRLTGRLLETAYVGVATQYVAPDEGRQRQHLRPEQRTGRAGTGAHGDLVEPGLHVRRRPHGGDGMTDQLTRRQLLERAALGGAAITLPGFLAACGSSGTKASSGTTTVEQKLAKTLHFSNWTLYMDTNKKNHTFPSLVEFKKKYGVNVDYVEDINDNAGFYGKIQGQLSRGQSTGRDIIVLTDNDRYLAQVIKKGWAEKLDKAAIPNIEEPGRRPEAPELRPGPRLQPALAVGHDGHRLQRHAHRPGAVGRRAAREPEAEREDHGSELDGRRAHARDALQR